MASSATSRSASEPPPSLEKLMKKSFAICSSRSAIGNLIGNCFWHALKSHYCDPVLPENPKNNFANYCFCSQSQILQHKQLFVKIASHCL